MVDVIILVVVVALLVLASSTFRIHPFIALLGAALVGGIAFGLPLVDGEETDGVVTVIAGGFGNLLGGIGLVIVLGTIIGVLLERAGAAVTMANVIIRLLGDRFPTLTISIIGYFVSIPVFCDSGYVILNSLKESLAKRTMTSPIAMSVALATGLYATHTFVPPTPGPIAAAGNLGLADQLGLVILVGMPVAAVTALAGLLWANRFRSEEPAGIEAEEAKEAFEEVKEQAGPLPGAVASFAPILVPIVLIMLGSVAQLPAAPFGEGVALTAFAFLGQPIVALLVGLLIALPLLRGQGGVTAFTDQVADAITAAAPILLITGAGGAFGAVIQATDLGDYLGTTLSGLGIGIFMPFLVSAALKSAQGSSTVALVTTSALVAPLLGSLGLDSDLGRVLVVMAIGAGAMTVSHANDSFFWVVTQFSRMSVAQAYRAQTAATLVQGVTGIVLVWLLSLVLV
ncbi:D-glycerate transporter (predicted) [Serinicoccus hydrothermalis]|uniref:D-glycerate transporter (Predicted) n=1 Tax=Serinicoccus hydrothermalis TaxID=1758689 RepID=A0A1B1NDE7_9MICO|nr:GntP family permease [Serinicoccus hydrothermalis]ANS79453.1 D-glycerate transporter (predicted) [Serinicoccus hydrothermalis]